MATLVNQTLPYDIPEQTDDYSFQLPDTIPSNAVHGSRHTSRKSSAAVQSRKSAKRDKDTESLPNLLKMSKLSRAVMKLAPAGSESGSSAMPRYTSSGHRCWSSLRTREWQEFQRMMRQDGEQQGSSYVTPVSFLHFNVNSPRHSLSTRGSKRPIRKQVASPDSGYYERARNNDFRRVEDAYTVTQQNKTQRWRDILEGVPSQYNSNIKPIKCKIIYEDEDAIKKRIRAQRQKWREEKSGAGSDTESTSPERTKSGDSRDRAQSGMTRGTSRTSCRSAVSSIHGKFTFPKKADFVPSQGTKVENMGVDWKYSKCHRDNISAKSLRAFSAPSAASHENIISSAPHPPKQHKASYNPVTEALRREGTTMAKIRGKVMGSNDYHVTKVWKRKLTSIINPAYMAKRDIPDSALRARKAKADCKMEENVSDDEDFSGIDGQSINRAESLSQDGQDDYVAASSS